MADSTEHRDREAGSGSLPNADEIDLYDYWRIVADHYKAILAITLVAAIIGVLASFLMPKVYCATTTIMPPLREDAASNSLKDLPGGLGSLVGRMGDDQNVTKRYLGILRSRAVADAVIDKFDLMNAYGAGKFRGNAAAVLAGNTHISLGDGGIIAIVVDDTVPARAAGIANFYVEQLDKHNKRLSGSQATSKREFIESRLKEVEAKLANPDSMLARETQIQQMLYELLVREYEAAKIEEAKSLPTVLVLDPATVPERKTRPARMHMGLGAGVVGFIMAICVVFVMDAKAKKH